MLNHISINKKKRERERKAQNLKKKKGIRPPIGTQRGFWRFFCPLPSMTKHHARCVGVMKISKNQGPAPKS